MVNPVRPVSELAARALEQSVPLAERLDALTPAALAHETGKPAEMLARARQALLASKGASARVEQGDPAQALREASAFRGLAQRWVELATVAKLRARPELTTNETYYLERLLGASRDEEVHHLVAEAKAGAALAEPGTPERRALVSHLQVRDSDTYGPALPREQVPLQSYRMRPDPSHALLGELSAYDAGSKLSLTREADDLLDAGQLASMKRDRDLSIYEFFAPGVQKDVFSLGRDQIWADVGSGNSTAMATYHGIRPLVGREPGQARTFSFDLGRTPQVTQLEERLPGRFRFFEGNVLGQDVPEQVDVLTDIYGALSYDPNVTALLEQYSRMLKKGGRLYLAFSENTFNSKGPWTEVVDASGKTQGLSDFLKNLDGFRVVSEKVRKGDANGLVLEKVKDSPQIPQVKLIGERWVDEPPAQRIFAQPGFIERFDGEG